MADAVIYYTRGERVTSGFDPEHARCKRKVESVTEHQTSYSGHMVQLSPCINCANPSVIPQIDMAWIRRG